METGMKKTEREFQPCPKCGNADDQLFDEQISFTSSRVGVGGAEICHVVNYTSCGKCGHICEARFGEETPSYDFPLHAQFPKLNNGPDSHTDLEGDSSDTTPTASGDDSSNIYQCPRCKQSDPDNFSQMIDIDTGVVLMKACRCGAHVVEDEALSESKYEMAPCPNCGNKDLNRYLVKLDEGCEEDIEMTCLNCMTDYCTIKATQQENALHNPTNIDAITPAISFKCECGNEDFNKFNAYFDDEIPVDVECGECLRCLPLIEHIQRPSKLAVPSTPESESTSVSDSLSVAASSSAPDSTSTFTADESGCPNQGDTSSISKYVPDKAAKKPSRIKGSLNQVADFAAQFLGFTSTDNCTQYFSRYGIRCVVKKAAYNVFDFGLKKSDEMGLLDPSELASNMSSLPENASLITVLGSKTGSFAAFRQLYVEYNTLRSSVERARNSRVAGGVNRDRFIQLVVRQVGQSLGTLIGSATGSFTGTLLLSVPVTVFAGNIAGLTVGALIGQGVGRMIGDQFGKNLSSGNQADGGTETGRPEPEE